MPLNVYSFVPKYTTELLHSTKESVFRLSDETKVAKKRLKHQREIHTQNHIRETEAVFSKECMYLKFYCSFDRIWILDRVLIQ